MPNKLKIVLLSIFMLALGGAAAYAYINYPRQALPEADIVPEPVPEEVDEVIVVEPEKASVSVRYVQEILKPASDLVTLKYYYTDADSYENHKEAFGRKLPLTTNRVVFTYDGEIGIGIDISKLDISVDNDAQEIVIVVPEPELIYNEIDAGSFVVPYESHSIFNETQMVDYTKLIDELKQKKTEKVLGNSEIMNEAKSHAEELIFSLIHGAAETADFEVVFR